MRSHRLTQRIKDNALQRSVVRDMSAAGMLGNKIMRGGGIGRDRWVSFVREWSKENGVSYMCALSNPDLKKDYLEKYPNLVKQTKVKQTKKGLLVHKIFKNGDRVPKGYSGTDEVFLRNLDTMQVFDLGQYLVGEWNPTTKKIDFDDPDSPTSAAENEASKIDDMLVEEGIKQVFYSRYPDFMKSRYSADDIYKDNFLTKSAKYKEEIREAVRKQMIRQGILTGGGDSAPQGQGERLDFDYMDVDEDEEEEEEKEEIIVDDDTGGWEEHKGDEDYINPLLMQGFPQNPERGHAYGNHPSQSTQSSSTLPPTALFNAPNEGSSMFVNPPIRRGAQSANWRNLFGEPPPVARYITPPPTRRAQPANSSAMEEEMEQVLVTPIRTPRAYQFETDESATEIDDETEVDDTPPNRKRDYFLDVDRDGNVVETVIVEGDTATEIDDDELHEVIRPGEMSDTELETAINTNFEWLTDVTRLLQEDLADSSQDQRNAIRSELVSIFNDAYFQNLFLDVDSRRGNYRAQNAISIPLDNIHTEVSDAMELLVRLAAVDESVRYMDEAYDEAYERAHGYEDDL